MIHRPRPTDSCPKSLKPKDPNLPDNRQSAGAKELAKIEAWLAARVAVPPPNPMPKRPAFNAYGGDDVKEALEKLFERKCAYCESLYASQQPVDVEHWRPKGRIDGEPEDIGGYEWIAMQWENLLPSCIDCNRARNQLIPDPNSAADAWITILVGKADQFPIAAGSARWRYGGNEAGEQPLLLNPCTDDPSKFFDFPDTGVLLPKTGLSAHDRLRATESIRVYALNRKNLVDERRRHVLRLELTFKLIRTLYQWSADPNVPAVHRTTAGALVVEALARLEDSALPQVPYSQFLAARVKEFIEHDLGIHG